MQIDKGQTIEISNDTFGSIFITLNDSGEYNIASDGPPINVQQKDLCLISTKTSKVVTNYSQTAFKDLDIKGDLIISSNINQTIK